MFNPWLLSALGIGHMLLLFGIAAWAHRNADSKLLQATSGVVFSLAVAVYISSWTFYSQAGNADRHGWIYMSTELGSMLVFLFAMPVLIQLFRYRQQHNISSIADYIGFRYGRDNRLAVLVTLICVLIVVPYLALQIKSTATAFSFLMSTRSSDSIQPLTIAALAMTAVLTLFAILFGTRIVDAHERNAGLMVALAFAALVKLTAFVVVGLVALLWLLDIDHEALVKAGAGLNLDNFQLTIGTPLFWVNLLLGMSAIICLPRQFHVQSVECRSEQELQTARWLVPVIIALFVLPAIPISITAHHHLHQLGVPGDLFMLALPLQQDSPLLTLISFMGGVSAAASMFVVSMIALTIMFSNHIVLPVLLRRQSWQQRQKLDFSTLVLLVRRLSMVLIAGLAFLFYLLIDHYATLSSLGYLALSLALQLAPAMLHSLRTAPWHRLAVHAGLIVGCLGWIVLLLLPGVFGIEPLFSQKPVTTAGLDGLLADISAIDIAWRTLITLLLNLLAMYATQWLCTALARDSRPIRTRRLQPLTRASSDNMITAASLYQLTASVCGAQRVERSFAGHFGTNLQTLEHQLASPQLIQYCERLLAASIGQVSAREIISKHLSGSHPTQSDAANQPAIDSTFEAIRFNRRMLELILENITTGVIILDQDQCVAGWNQRYVDLMRFPPGMPYQGQTIVELMQIMASRGYFDGNDATQQINTILDYFRQHRPLQRVRHWHDTGQIIEVIGKPLHTQGYMLTFTDITQSRQHELELRQYTDNIPGAICYTDRDEIIRFVNKAFEQICGHARTDMIGKPIRAIMSDERYQRQAEFRRRANHGERVQFETRLVVNNDERTYAIEFIPFVDARGEYDGFYSVSQDITSFRNIEQELRQKERDIREYTDRSPVMLLYIDQDLVIRFVNRAFVNTMGFLATEFIGKRVEEVLPDHMSRYNHAHRQAALAGNIQRFEADFIDEFGQKRYLDVGYYPDRDDSDHGRVRGYYTVAQDITERKLAELALEQANLNLERRVQERTTELHNLNLKLIQANQQAQQANASKTRFLAAASHDLLQPMNAARLFISVIRADMSALSARHRDLIEHIDHSLENSENLLDKLLEISKLDAGYQRTDVRPFNLHATLHPLLQVFDHLCAQKGIELRMRCDASLYTTSDPQLLYRMVQNLLANAVRYTSSGGVLISSRLLRGSGKIRIAIYDTGPGIPESELQDIFREFHQLDTTPDNSTGLGLGLTIVERLAQLLGHSIGVRSVLGQGSCFWIDLPVADASLQDQAATDNPDNEAGQTRAGNQRTAFLQGRKILCIDDDDDNRIGLGSLLQQWGAEVRQCASSVQAHDILQHEPEIDIVLSDYQLLQENSMNMLASLQSHSAHKLHVIIITAEQLPDTEAVIRAHGHTLLRKPLQPARLRKLLQNLVSS